MDRQARITELQTQRDGIDTELKSIKNEMKAEIKAAFAPNKPKRLRKAKE